MGLQGEEGIPYSRALRPYAVVFAALIRLAFWLRYHEARDMPAATHGFASGFAGDGAAAGLLLGLLSGLARAYRIIETP